MSDLEPDRPQAKKEAGESKTEQPISTEERLASEPALDDPAEYKESQAARNVAPIVDEFGIDGAEEEEEESTPSTPPESAAVIEARLKAVEKWTGQDKRDPEDPSPKEVGFSERAEILARKQQAEEWNARLKAEAEGRNLDPDSPQTWRKDYNPKSVAALREMMGGAPLEEILSQHGFSDKQEGPPEGTEQGRNAYHLRQFLRAESDEQRQSALQGLEQEALSGNAYALQMLKTLALTDAARKLHEATTPEEQKKALKELAGIELGDEQSPLQKGKDTLLNNFPSGDAQTQAAEAKLSPAERQVRSEQRQKLLAEAKTESKQEALGTKTATDLALLNALTGDSTQRKEAIRQLEKEAGRSLLGGDYVQAQRLADQLKKAKVSDAVSDLASTDNPAAAAKLLAKIGQMAVGNNSDASKVVQVLPRDSKILDELAAKDPEAQAKALASLKRDLSEPIADVQQIQRKSASELLAEFAKGDREAVEKARQESAQEAQENFARADQHLATYLDRKATPEQRQEAIKGIEEADKARMRALRSDSYNDILHNVQAAEQARGLQQSLGEALKQFDPQSQEADADGGAKLTADVKRRLEELVTATSSGDPKKNSAAYQYISNFKKGELDQLLKDLDEPKKQEAALLRIQKGLTSSDTVLDQMRVGRIVRTLDKDATPEQFAVAVKALTKESRDHGNTLAGEWLKWAEPAAALAAMKPPATIKEVTAAVDHLTKLAPDNAYARRALAAFLVSDSDRDRKLDWQTARHGSVNGKPTYVPDLDNMSRQNPEAISAAKMQAVKALSEATGQPKPGLTTGEAASLAITMVTAQDRIGSTKEEIGRSQQLLTASGDLLKRTIAEQAGDPLTNRKVPSEGSYDAMSGVLQILTSKAAGREALVDVYLSGAKHPRFSDRFSDFERMALTGDRPATAILAATSAGISDTHGLGAQAARALETASVDPEARRVTREELLKAFEKYGDQDKLLETLGAVAHRDGAISVEIRSALEQGAESTDAKMHRSAVAGLMKAAEQWTPDDAEIVSNHLTPEMVAGLAQSADRIPAQIRTGLIAEWVDRLDHSRKVDIDDPAKDLAERVGAARALGALGKYVTEQQTVLLGRYGDATGQQLTNATFKDAPGRQGLESLGFTPAQATALQTEVGKSVLQILGKSENGKVQEAAFESFGLLRWDGIGTKAVRTAIVDYVRGRGDIPLELHEKVSKLIYDANIPLPAAAVLRQMHPGLSDAEYYSRAQQIGKHYATKDRSAETFIRETSAQAALWNSLESSQRRNLTGSDKELAPSASLEITSKNMDHRLFNALPSAVRQSLSGSPAQIPGDAPFPDFSGKQLSSEMFNSLTPELRRQLTGTIDDIDMAQLEGVMFNGKMDDKFAHLLPEHFGGKSLTQMVRENANAADAAAVSLASKSESLVRDKEAQLRALCEMAKEGPGFGAYAGNVLTLGGLLDDSPLDEWEKKQGAQVREIRAIEGRMEETAQALAERSQERDILRFSQTIGDYQMLLNTASRKEADLTAARMLRDYGPDMMKAYAPKAYEALTRRSGEGNYGRSGLQRLHDNGLASISEFPEYSQDPSKRFHEGLNALVKWPPKASSYGADVEAYRRAALRAIDADPDLNAFADVGRAMNKNMKPLSEMFQAAAEGKKYKEFVNDAKARATEMSDALSKITPAQVNACKEKLAHLEGSLNGISDATAKAAVQDKIKALQEMLKISDPSSAERKQLDGMLDAIKSRDFSADTAVNWLKENAVVIGVTILAGAITVLSMGAASPLAVILVTSAVCLGSAQAAKEGLYLVNHYVGDTGLGKLTERSYVGAWGAKTYDKAKLYFDSKDGRSDAQNEEEFAKLLTESVKSLGKDVLLPLTTEYLTNVVLGVACFGLGQIGAQGLKGIAPSNLRAVLLSKPGAQMAAQMEQVAAISARNPAGKQFLNDWMGRFARETRQNIKDTVVEETTGQVADLALQKYVGQGNSWLAIGLSGTKALIDGRRGRHHMHLDGDTVRTSPEFQPELLAQYRRDGHTVHEVSPGNHEIRAYNAVPGDPPVRVALMARGEGTPPRELTPDGQPMRKREASELPTHVEVGDQTWRSTPEGQRALADVGKMTDHFIAGDYDKVVQTAADLPNVKVSEKTTQFDLDTFRSPGADQNKAMDAYLSSMSTTGSASATGDAMTIPRPTVKVNGVEVDLVTGKASVGNTVGDGLKIAAAEGEVAKFRNSKEGQRILAERAIIAMEEGFHIRQAQAGAPISPSYAQFINETGTGAERDAGVDQSKRTKEHFEQEVILALYDKGWTVDQLKHHFGEHHTAAREKAFKWLDAQEAKTTRSRQGDTADVPRRTTDAVPDKPESPTVKPRPEFDAARQRDMVTEIQERVFGDRPLTKPQFDQMLAGMDASQKRLAIEILEQAAPNMTQRAVDQQMQNLLTQIDTTMGGVKEPIIVYALQGDSSANALAYLLKKQNPHKPIEVRQLDKAALQDIAANGPPKNVLLLGDLSPLDSSTNQLAKAQREALAKVENLMVADLSGFDRSLNMYDFGASKLAGPQLMQGKLNEIAGKVQELQRKQPGLSNEDAVRQVLHPDSSTSVKDINPNAKLLSTDSDLPGKKLRKSTDASDEQKIDSLYNEFTQPTYTKAEIESFLAKLGPQKREIAAYLLKDGVTAHTYADMMTQMKDLHQKVIDQLPPGTKPEDIYIVTGLEKNGSGYMLNHLYPKVTGVPGSNVISVTELAARGPGAMNGKVIVFLDDYACSGRQLAGLVRDNADVIRASGGKPVAATLGSHETSVNPWKLYESDSRYEPLRGLDVTVASSQVSPDFYKRENLEQRGLLNYFTVQEVQKGGGKSALNGSLTQTAFLTPYGGPNNNIKLIAEFEDHVRKQRRRAASK